MVGPGHPLRGGLVQFDESICRWLKKEGHDASIISYSLQYPEFLFPGSTQYDYQTTAPKDVEIHTLINTVNPFSWLKTALFIRKQKPDLVIMRFWLPFFGPALGTIARLAKRKGTIIMALTDNAIPHEKRIGDFVLAKYFFTSCDAFITMSDAVNKDLNQFTQSKIRVNTPHPMFETYGEPVSQSEARKQLGLDEDGKYILFFGLIRHYKGLDIALKALAEIVKVKPEVKMIIAGEYYEKKETYLEIIRDLHLEGHLVMHDNYIENEKVRYYFCASDLLIQPYRSATNSGVSMVSYFYEKPVLVTNVGGLPEIVPHMKAGYVCGVNETSVAKAVIDFYSENRAKEFQKGVLEIKENYSWPVFIGKVMELFKLARNGSNSQ